MNIYPLLLVCFVLFFASNGYSQTSDEELKKFLLDSNQQRLVVNNSRMLQENFFYFADKTASRLLEINPESANYNYRKGFILLEMRSQFENAIKHLIKASKLINKNFDMYSSAEKAAPPDVFYHLGRAYHLNEQYDSAIINYNLFLKNTSKQSELIQEAKLRIQQCNIALKEIANPKMVTIKNIGVAFNTVNSEYSPQISLDGRSLHFTSRREWANNESESYRDPMFNNLTEDIYQLKLDKTDNWGIPERLDFSLPQINESSVSISVDERTIYLYKDSINSGDIFISEYSNNKFNRAVPLTIKNINTNAWESHIIMSPSGKFLYFVSDRVGGKGKKDIYCIEKRGENWSEPVNLKEINTEYDEETPFVGLEDNILYFSSNNAQSMGGFDVFMTTRDTSGKWTSPVNLGYPTNSAGDDLNYTKSADEKKAYLSSLRKGGFGEKDIYEITYTDVKTKNIGFLFGKIIDVDGKKIPESAYVTLTCTNCELGFKEKIFPRIDDGAFFSRLEKCREYELAYYFKNNSSRPYKQIFKTNCDFEYQAVYKNAILFSSSEIISDWFDYELNGVVISYSMDDSTKLPLENALIEIYNQEGKKVESINTNSTGVFISKLTKGMMYGQKLDYIAVVSAQAHTQDTFDIKITLSGDSIIQLSYQVNTFKNLEKLLELNDIYFEENKSDLTNEAILELDKVVYYLLKYPSLKVEIHGHTDDRGSNQDNLILSQNRCKTVCDYLNINGIDSSRLSSIGFGKSKPKFQNNSISNRSKNRRTEFIIQK